MKKSDLQSKLREEEIVAAIERAEKNCSGEIRVHIEPSLLGKDVRAWAERTFERLGMTKTEQRNGVLLFIAAREQQFAIIGDRGIHERVGAAFWSDLADKMTTHFRREEFTEGVVEAIELAGRKLIEQFPYTKGDVNELPDAVSYGNDDDSDR